MTEKIKLTKQQAEVIENIKTMGFNQIMWKHTHEDWERRHGDVLEALSSEQLATALIVGYEVKLTANEIIIKDYNSALKSRNETTSSYKERFFDGYLLGVESTLETLGIEIEGIK